MGANDFNFDLPPGETFVPSADRVRALTALMPKEPFAIAPIITDRAAWSRWQNDDFGRLILKTARELATEPFPDYTDATYLDCLDREDVTKINQVMPASRKRQTMFLLAEAIYDQGEFLDAIIGDIRKLSALRTWIHPGNDLKRLNYDLKTVEVDLGVAHTGKSFAQIDYILGPRLPAEVRTLISNEVQRRMLQPLRTRLETGKDIYWWLIVKHNWNAVCLSCYAHTAAALLPGAEDRAWWFAFCEALVKNFRESFTDDGFCTEGVSYWSYGFMHYISIGEILRLATGDTIDLLDEPKMARAARFPDYAEIQPGVWPSFADCAIDAKPVMWTRLWPDNRKGTLTHQVEPVEGLDLFKSMSLQFNDELFLWMFQTRDPYRPMRWVTRPALRNWFENSSLLICRPGPSTQRQFSATLLGGNNGVNHNHNDLGTFTVLLDGHSFVLDPGAEVYSFRTFSAQRYDSQLLNSYGHPVPRVAGQLQQPGAEFRARVVSKEFTDEVDRMILDLRHAYSVDALRKLEREFIYDRRGAGSLTIIDRVEFAEPSAFESALITLSTIAIDGRKIRFTDGDAVIEADVCITGGGAVALPDAQHPEMMAHVCADSHPPLITTDTINQPPHPKRLALVCRGPVTVATIKVVFRPV